MGLYSSIILYIALFLGLYYQIFILITFFENETDKKCLKSISSDSPDLPSVSIIVPCFNEENTVQKTIASLLELNYPKDKLLITVVDDGSTDSTYEKAMTFVNHERVKIFTQKNGGKFSAMNFGIKNSNTDVVACLDADSMVTKDALIKMIPYFNGENIVAVTPAMKVYNPKSILRRIQNTEYNVSILLKKIMSKLDAIHVTPGPFSLFKREIFEKIGYFKAAYNTEDMEIAFRIQSFRYRIANCPNALVYTVTPDTFKKLYKQRIRWAYGFLKNLQDYRHILFNPKYGNIGMLTLPFAALSIAISILIFWNTVYNFAYYIIEHIHKYFIAGFSFRWFSLDLFYLNTSSIALLTFIVFCLGLGVILLSWKMSKEKFANTIDIFYFVTLYGFIAPLWIIKASYNAVLSKQSSWR